MVVGGDYLTGCPKPVAGRPGPPVCVPGNVFFCFALIGFFYHILFDHVCIVLSCRVCCLFVGETSGFGVETMGASSSKRRRSVRLSSLSRQYYVNVSSSSYDRDEIIDACMQVSSLTELVATELGTRTLEPFVSVSISVLLVFLCVFVCFGGGCLVVVTIR